MDETVFRFRSWGLMVAVCVLLGNGCRSTTAVSVSAAVGPRDMTGTVPRLEVPYLEGGIHVDGDLSEWRERAFTDGVWDIHRVMQAPWFRADINRLTDHGNEPPPEEDLAARYYIAWDDTYLYFGAEVRDNVNDVDDPAHEDKRWYFKDCVAWFVEAPRDDVTEGFGQGNNGFCFVVDETRPAYGAWWRYGTPEASYVEEPLPAGAGEYALRMDPWGTGQADFILEARVNMAMTLGRADPDWRPPRIGDVYGLEIVHTDPDGGDYGGHLIMYGTGDDDATWGRMILTGPIGPVLRKEEF